MGSYRPGESCEVDPSPSPSTGWLFSRRAHFHPSPNSLCLLLSSFPPTSLVTSVASTGCGGCFWRWVSGGGGVTLTLCGHQDGSSVFFAVQASCCLSGGLLTTPESESWQIPFMPLFLEQGYSSSIRGKVELSACL